MSILLKNLDILYYEDGWKIIENGNIGIENDAFNYIGKAVPTKKYTEERDLTGCLAMPGLYNLHSHTPMALLRGLGSHLPLDRWLREAMFPIEARYTDEETVVGAQISIMEMIASGVVSFSDMYHSPEAYMDEVIKSGITANLTLPVMDFGDGDFDRYEKRLHDSVAFFDKIGNATGQTIQADFAIHAEYTSSENIVGRYAKFAKERGARFQLHLSETSFEHEGCKQRHGKTPTRWFYDLGVFDCPVIAAHCIWLEDDDIKIMHDRGATAVHNPSSNMKLGSGFMKIRKLLDEGVRVAIGTDGSASNNNQNMFEELHLTALIHCGAQQDPTILSPGEVLKMGTINGALAQGRENCGNIQIGYKADLAILDLNKPHLMPNHDVPSLLVYTAQASDVKMTISKGKIIYEDGCYHTMDIERIKFNLERSLKRLFG